MNYLLLFSPTGGTAAAAEALAPYVAQAERDSERFHDGLPAVFHRRNRQGWLVTMRLPDWLEMYQKVPKSTT